MLVCKMNFGSLLAAVVAITASVSQLSNKHLVLWGKKDNLAFADEISYSWSGVSLLIHIWCILTVNSASRSINLLTLYLPRGSPMTSKMIWR